MILYKYLLKRLSSYFIKNYQYTILLEYLSKVYSLASAQSNLGVMYSQGQGVIQDYSRGYMWFNLAAVKNYSYAVQNRNIVAKKITLQQVADAQKLARECQARNFKNCD